MEIASNQELVGLLSDHPLFQDLEPSERQELAAMMVEQQYPAGTEIFREGDPGGDLYLIASGSVEVQKQRSHGSGRVVIARFDRGGLIGEMSLVDRLPRSASVVTVQPVRAWLLSQSAFSDILASRPTMAIKLLHSIAKVLSQRLRSTSGWFADVY
ncbi:MAG: cyclic nucleotide-binding domain-containing protein [bacterium]